MKRVCAFVLVLIGALGNAYAQTKPSATVARKPVTLFEPPPGEAAEHCKSFLDVFRRGREQAAALAASPYAQPFEAGMAERLEETIRENWEHCSRGFEREKQSLAREKAQKAADAADRIQATKDAEENERRHEERMSKPSWYVPMFSAVICEATAARQEAKRAIAEMRSLARRSGGGVIDLEAIHGHQEEMGEAEEHEQHARLQLKANRKAPVACTARLVRAHAECLEVRPREACTEGWIQDYLKDRKR